MHYLVVCTKSVTDLIFDNLVGLCNKQIHHIEKNTTRWWWRILQTKLSAKQRKDGNLVDITCISVSLSCNFEFLVQVLSADIPEGLKDRVKRFKSFINCVRNEYFDQFSIVFGDFQLSLRMYSVLRVCSIWELTSRAMCHPGGGGGGTSHMKGWGCSPEILNYFIRQ